MTAQADGGHSASRRAPQKSIKSFLVRLKVRLQFSGWLQYVLNALVAMVFLLLAAGGRLIGVWSVVLFWLPAGVGTLLLLALAFDLVTVKMGLRPTEGMLGRRDGLDAFDLMRVRRSCRSFQSRNLVEAHRAGLLRSVGVHSQPEGLIGDGPIRLEYIAAPLKVWPTVGAHEFLVAVAPHQYNRMAVIDVGRSLQKVVLDATRMGLATCWIGPGADHRSVVRHLGDRFDPARDHIICVCALGYRSRFMPTFIRVMQLVLHRRLPLTSLFFADSQFRRPLDVQAAPFASLGRCYEACRWSASSYNAQTTRCVAAVERIAGRDRPTRFDFYATTASRYYAAVAVGILCANWETGCQALGISGQFAVLDPRDRGVREPRELPRYDVSWVLDRPQAVTALSVLGKPPGFGVLAWRQD